MDEQIWSLEAIEKAVTETVCSHLHIPTIDIDGDFLLQLGTALYDPQSLVGEINRQFKLNLPIKSVYEKCSVRKLAEKVHQTLALEFTSAPPLEQPFGRKPRTFPLSHVQNDCWFRYQQHDDPWAAASRYAITIRPSLSPPTHRRQLLVHRRLQQLLQQQSLFRNVFYTHRQSREPTGFVLLDEQAVPVQTPASATAGYLCPYVCLQRERNHRQPVVPMTDVRPPVRFRLVQSVASVQLGMELSMQKILTDTRSLADVAELVVNESLLPNPHLQYVDFANWQVQHHTIDSDKGKLKKWRQLIEGVEEMQLPMDRSKHTNGDIGEDLFVVRQQFEIEEYKRALELCRLRLDCDFKHLVLAVLFTHLSQLTEQQCIAIATIGSHKTSMTQLENVLGNWENVMILPLTKATRTFAELVAYVYNQCNRIAEIDVPAQVLAEYIVRAKNEDVSEKMFTKVLFSYAELRKEINIDSHLPDFTDYALDVQVLSDHVSLNFRASQLMFRETVTNWSQRFMQLFREVLHGSLHHSRLPTSHYSRIQYFSRELELETPSRDVGLHKRIQEAISQHPMDRGLLNGKRCMLFGEIRHCCDRVADIVKQRLIATTGNTFTPGALVGIVGDETVEAYCALLGSLCTGSAHVPISDLDPIGRKQHIVADANLSTLLTKRGTAHELDEKRMCYVDQALRTDVIYGAHPRRRYAANGADTAYLIYTSGTTGLPKGVCVQQASLPPKVVTYTSWCHVRNRVLITSRFTFDPSVSQTVTALLTGSIMILPVDKNNSYDALAGQRIVSYCDSTPTSLLNMGRKLRARMANMENMATGSEAVPGKLLNNLSTCDMRSYNSYGPTECTDFVTWTPIKVQYTPLTIGKPTNESARIIDADDRPVGIGEVGECVFAGDSLATGYIGSPEKTAKAFQLNPFQTRRQQLQRRYNRMYKTGDKLKWFPDGDLICLGRIDQQIKLRGLRLELEEVESLLCACPLVSTAAVTVLNDASGKPQNLAVAYVPGKGAMERPEMASHLKAWLAKSLPAFVLPAFYVPVDSFPTTNSDKLDRRLLAKTVQEEIEGQTGGGGGGDQSVPSSHLEVVLVALWQEVLSVYGNITIDSNFFSNGGNSLLTLQLRQRISESVQVNVKVTDIFRNQTPREMAQFIGADMPQTAVTSTLHYRDGLTPSQGSCFSLHPAICGGVFPYHEIFRRIGWPGALYGVEHPNTFEERMPNCPFDAGELVDMYVRDMNETRAAQPRAMIGLSLGGTLAYMINERLPKERRMLMLNIDCDPFMEGESRQGFNAEGLVFVISNFMPNLDKKTLRQLVINSQELWRIFITNGPQEFPHADYPMFNFIAGDYPAFMYPGGFDVGAYTSELSAAWNRAAGGRLVPYDNVPGFHTNMTDAQHCAKMAAKSDAILAELSTLHGCS